MREIITEFYQEKSSSSVEIEVDERCFEAKQVKGKLERIISFCYTSKNVL
jgi:hypothetical protein